MHWFVPYFHAGRAQRGINNGENIVWLAILASLCNNAGLPRHRGVVLQVRGRRAHKLGVYIALDGDNGSVLTCRQRKHPSSVANFEPDVLTAFSPHRARYRE